MLRRHEDGRGGRHNVLGLGEKEERVLQVERVINESGQSRWYYRQEGRVTDRLFMTDRRLYLLASYSQSVRRRKASEKLQ